MNDQVNLRLLFIINPGSGNNTTDWPMLIRQHFSSLPHTVELFDLPDPCTPESVQQKITAYKPDRVIAVGGDGTVKLVAECLLHSEMLMGILPAGSANGMAKELGIPSDALKAIDLTANGQTKKIHLVKINDDLCIHLSDIGFNAFVVKKFDSDKSRGMWGYVKAAWKVLWNQPLMEVQMQINHQLIKRQAAMVVVANATRYGTGALINPDGKLDDNVFEVIILKKISLTEIFKMVITHMDYDPAKTEVFQTDSFQMHSRKKAHFQVDGEYLGKVNDIKAAIIPDAVKVIIP